MQSLKQSSLPASESMDRLHLSSKLLGQSVSGFGYSAFMTLSSTNPTFLVRRITLRVLYNGLCLPWDLANSKGIKPFFWEPPIVPRPKERLLLS
jgi:hypothetical protein